MSQARPPQQPGPPGGSDQSLREVLARLDLMEKKIDWIAHRFLVSAPAVDQPAGSSGHAPTDRISVTPAPSTAANGSAVPMTPPNRAPARQADPFASRPGAPGAAAPAKDSPAQRADQPAAPAAPASAATSHGGWHSPSVESVGTASGTGAAYGRHTGPTGAARVPSYGIQPRQDAVSQGPAAAPSWLDRARAEGTIGRYLLSGAAALLIVLAAVTLIALVWHSIPDAVKVATTGVLAVAMVGSGTWLVCNRGHLRVAGATLTGTGGALGFVAVIGGVLLDGLIPIYPAFVMMIIWGVTLLFVSSITRLLFTGVVSTTGALVTVTFATAQMWRQPDTAVVIWFLIISYLVLLAVITTILSRQTDRMPSAVWYPLTSLVVICFAIVIMPERSLLPDHPLIAIVAVMVLLCLLSAHALDAGRHLWRHGRHYVAGWDAGVVGTAAVIKGLSLLSALEADEGMDSWQPVVGACLLALICAITVALLKVPGASAWRRTVLGVQLGAATVVSLTTTVIGSVMVGPAALVIGGAAWATAYQGIGWSVLIPPSAAIVLVSPRTEDSSSAMKWLPLLAGLTLIVATIEVERALRTRTGRQAQQQPAPATGLPVGAVGPLQARDLTLARAAAWIVGGVLAIEVPLVLQYLVSDGPFRSDTVAATAMSLTLIAWSLLGLALPTTTLLDAVRGKALGRLPGADSRYRALHPTPPRHTSTVVGLLTLGLLIDCSMSQFTPLGDGIILVFVSTGLCACACRFLLPWFRRPSGGLPVVILCSMTLWSSVIALTGQDTNSVLVTVVVLGSGSVFILLGFRLMATAVRHYGLALVMVSVLKLALLDVAVQSSIVRVLALFVAGLVCFGLSLAYNKAAADSDNSGGARVPQPQRTTATAALSFPPATATPGGPGRPSQPAQPPPPAAADSYGIYGTSPAPGDRVAVQGVPQAGPGAASDHSRFQRPVEDPRPAEADPPMRSAGGNED